MVASCECNPRHHPLSERPVSVEKKAKATAAGDTFVRRLDRVRGISHNFGYGVGDDLSRAGTRYR
jgi:hypothetical protein